MNNQRTFDAPKLVSNDVPKASPAHVTVDRIRNFAQAQTPEYLLLVGVTLFLTIFGVAMVLSSSTIESNLEGDGFLGGGFSQAIYALFGILFMFVASRVSERLWIALSWLLLLAGCCMQLLVFTPLGVRSGGNTNWVNFFGFQLQPSEFLKVALVIWLGAIASRKKESLDSLKRGLIPVFLVAAVAIGFVVIAGDLGTSMIMVVMVFGGLFFLGVRIRFFILPIALVAAFTLILVAGSGNRSTRVSAFFSTCANYDYASCYQVVSARFALAHGGLFGVGYGQSTAKWSKLPAAKSDFIFAVIGEEFGLIGCTLVLILFALLAIAFLRLIRSAPTRFARAVTGTVFTWIIVQAFVNIAVVLNLLPALGVPLPFVSAGGTSLISTLVAIGIVLSVSRAGVVRNPNQ